MLGDKIINHALFAYAVVGAKQQVRQRLFGFREVKVRQEEEKLLSPVFSPISTYYKGVVSCCSPATMS